jgi:tetratricopeptide (TPR) repeat protein
MWISRFSLEALHVPAAFLGAALSVAGSAQGPKTTLAEMNAALQAGEADRALMLANSLPQDGTNDAEAQNLECRVHFTLQQWDAAANACRQAVDLDQGNSNYHMWLGRALGERADQASFLTAFSLSKQVRAEFEEAVRLNPRNAEALSDLGEFYQEAPSIIGGGLDKAERVAAQLDTVDPARAHQLRAEIAEQRKDYGTAERQLKQAIASSAHPAFQWTVLGSFYERRGRWPEMEWAIQNCVAAAERDRTAGVALYDGAGVLIRARRNPQLAAKMLEDYLAGLSITEEAPAFVAHYRLAWLLAQMGDKAGAAREQAAGYAIAHEYRPQEAER